MESLKEQIKSKALSLGFDLFGVAPNFYSPQSHDKLLRWLNKGYHGEMAYMARAPRKRYDPRLFFDNTKSIIVVGINYYKEPNFNKDQPYISIYARGKPYQDVIRGKLKELLEFIQHIDESARGKIAVDTSPTADKLWAQLSGIGWQGKNTVVLNRKLGSFIFLGELFINIELEPDQPETDHCADCTACVDACPTGALEEPYLLNANKCISYLTTEINGDIKSPSMVSNHIFGCDICQIVCPYNKNATETKTPELKTQYDISPGVDYLRNLADSEFQHDFGDTVLGEHGYSRVMKNAKNVINNLGRMPGET